MSANIESEMPGDEDNETFKQRKQKKKHSRRAINHDNISNETTIDMNIKMSISKEHESSTLNNKGISVRLQYEMMHPPCILQQVSSNETHPLL